MKNQKSKIVQIAASVVALLAGNLIATHTRAHNETINGVLISIEGKFQHEKRAFQLHGLLTPQETTLVAQAMNSIAATINEARTNPKVQSGKTSASSSAQHSELRRVQDLIDLRPNESIAVKRVHSWKVTDEEIIVQVDYFEPIRKNTGPSIARDTYRFKKTEQGWQFAGHPTEKPIGMIPCKYAKKSNSGIVCELPGT